MFTLRDQTVSLITTCSLQTDHLSSSVCHVFMFLHDSPPGPAYDLNFSEVRSNSLVLLWKAPVYTGASAVTGYLVDMAKKGSSEFVSLTEEAVKHRYLQVGDR